MLIVIDDVDVINFSHVSRIRISEFNSLLFDLAGGEVAESRAFDTHAEACYELRRIVQECLSNEKFCTMNPDPQYIVEQADLFIKEISNGKISR